jgi:SPP1 gp7 family putative phage head morphogenesis protein
MQRSLVYWLKAEYRKNPPASIAQDATAAETLRRAFRKLGKRWLSNFDKLSDELAEYFAAASRDRVDGALRSMLRERGFTVKLQMSPGMRDAYQAVIGENVALIRSVAAKHLTDIEGDVMRSVAAGRDLGQLADAMEKTYGVTKRRAALIAKDQNNKATATLTRVRHLELGITKARWLHSAGGKTPRPEHVAFSGKTYDIAKGAFLEGVWTWPGMEINCRCVSVPVIPGFDD